MWEMRETLQNNRADYVDDDDRVWVGRQMGRFRTIFVCWTSSIMSPRSEYDRFLKSIGPFSFSAIIRVVADLHYGFVPWLRGPDTREIWKARILRHMLLLTCAPASDSAPALSAAPASYSAAPAPSAAPASDSAPAPSAALASSSSSSAALAQQLHFMEMATLPTCYVMADAMVAAGIHDLDCLKGLESSREDLNERLLCVYSFSGLHIRKIQLFLQGIPAVSYAVQEKVHAFYVFSAISLLIHCSRVLCWVQNALVLLQCHRLRIKLIP
jgi:hypothetical protein